MFTGIIEKTTRVIGVADGPMFRRLTLASQWDDVRHGESIAINGVCLTVAEITPGQLAFDVIQETLRKTNLGFLKGGETVHAERSLRVGDRIDGHFVQGHVDGPAALVDRVSTEKEVRLRLQVAPQLAKFVAPKGSVCIDGVSLTVAAVNGQTFEVALIPTTIQLTTLAKREIGWPYNFEADILSKQIVSWLEARFGEASLEQLATRGA